MKTGEEQPNKGEKTPSTSSIPSINLDGGVNQGEQKSEPEQEKAPEKSVTALEEAMSVMAKKIEALEAEKKNQKQDAGGLTSDAIAKLVEGAIRGSKGNENWSDGVDEAQIDPDDYEPEGVRFCHPSMGYVIADDKRKGQIVRLPYNKPYIFFAHESTRIIQQGRYGATAPVSSYTSYSKKEIKWIREHSIYGTVIFETTKQAMDQRAEFAMRMAPIMTVVQDYDFPSLMKRCQEYGIPMSDNTNALRANLAMAMAERSMESDKKFTERILFNSASNKGIAESLGK